MKLRMIKEEDIKDVLSIYRPFITNTPITFEYTVPSYRKFVKRVHKICTTYPWLVAEIDGQVVGYAYTSRFKERAAFSWDAEFSVYIREEFHGQNIGRNLYCALEEISKLQGIYNIYSLITSTAKNSINYHKAMGFEYIYTLENCGWKFDHWYGLVFYHKKIGDFSKVPEPIIPIEYIEKEKIEAILEKYSISD